MPIVTFRLPDDTTQALDELAQAAGATRSDLLRDLVARGLAETLPAPPPSVVLGGRLSELTDTLDELKALAGELAAELPTTPGATKT
jgi:hypothetical protein